MSSSYSDTSSTRRGRNRSMEKNLMGLSAKEIEEQLLNSDLKVLGINEAELNGMEVEEKQQLLTALKQSTSIHQPRPQEGITNQNKKIFPINNDEPISCNSSPNPESIGDKNEIDISIDSPEEYPSLPSPASSNRRNIQPRMPMNRQQQEIHRQQILKQQIVNESNSKIPVDVISVNSKQEESGEDEPEGDEEEEEDDDEDEEDDDEDDDDDDDDEVVEDSDKIIEDDMRPFSFPNFIDDDGPSLNHHAIKEPTFRCTQYYSLHPKLNEDSIRLMLSNYNSWYKCWQSLEKNNVMLSGYNYSNRFRKCQKLHQNNHSVSSHNVASHSIAVSNDIHSINIDKRICIEKSPSPDIEEIEVTEIKTTDSSRLTPNAKAKTLPRENKANNVSTPSSSSEPMITSISIEKSNCDDGKQQSKRGRNLSNRPVSKENQGQPKGPPQDEVRVQCPICQLEFAQSKIVAHAAGCVSFPIETRNKPSTSKDEKSSNKDGLSTSSTVVELTNSEPKVAKKRGN